MQGSHEEVQPHPVISKKEPIMAMLTLSAPYSGRHFPEMGGKGAPAYAGEKAPLGGLDVWCRRSL